MRSERASEVIERIAAEARTAPGGVLAFDGDGTLWSGDVGEDYFRNALALGDFRAPALARMKEEALAFCPGKALPEGPALASFLYDEYFAGRYPEAHVCSLMAWCFAGWSDAEVRAFAAESLVKSALGPRLHPEVQEVVAWARETGVEVFIVSASPRAIVEAAAEVVGVLPSHVVAATPLYEEGRMRAAVEEPIPYGPGKVSNLEALVKARPLLGAFGDNVFDLALLGAARVPVAVRPKPRLLAQASAVPTLVTLLASPPAE